MAYFVFVGYFIWNVFGSIKAISPAIIINETTLYNEVWFIE